VRKAGSLLALFAAAALASACGAPRLAQLPEPTPADQPTYGGTLNIGTLYVTLSALSWDPADWTWKSNHDAGMVREQLFAGDLDKAVSRGGPFQFIAEGYLPEAGIRGELAQSWEWEDPLTLVVHMRPGVMFQEVPNVMKARELVAEDVVFTYSYLANSPRRIPAYFDHIDSVEARDERTVVFRFNTYNAEWDYRFGWGYYSGIIPTEAASIDQRDWRKLVGTGPFRLSRYVQGNVQTYTRNPYYWDTETISGKKFAIPFVDEVNYRIIKDEATFLTGIRTGKLDILETIRWIAVDHLKETTPELKWQRWLSTLGQSVVLRVDTKPFDDIRVRRALNLAIDQREIVRVFYGGHAELLAFPQHPDFGPYYQPLEEMPASVQELFDYAPEKARRLLAEAGYPEGFNVTVDVCSCTPDHMDLLPLIVDYWDKIGVKVTIRPLEYAAFLSAMTTRTHSAGYLMNTGHVNPYTTLRKNFVTGQTWNASMYSNPAFDAKIKQMYAARDEAERVRLAREMTADMLDEAPAVWLPIQYIYTAWWPWVRNYGGELRAGAVRPGPIYARIWIDEKMKREMGFR
jgi:peptide/nickel transport system substrate-binding protein